MEYWQLIEHSHRLSRVGKFVQALQMLKQARLLEPNDLLIDYSEAGTLFAMGNYAQADALYQGLLSMDAKEFAAKSCGRGKSWSDTIKLDCLYEQARCKICLNNYPTGIALMKKHLSLRRRGLYSEYSKKEVEQDLFIRKVEFKNNNKDFANTHIMSAAQSHRFSTHVRKLKANGDSTKLKKYLQQKLRTFPDEYFIHLSLAELYDSCGNYAEALSHARASYNQAGHDPLCIYTLSKMLMKNDCYSEAIEIANEIQQADINEIAYGPNGEGMRWAKSILNDALFVKAYSLAMLNDSLQAHPLIVRHIANRRGIYSDFNHKQTMMLLELCQNNQQ